MALIITGFCVIGCAKVVDTAELARRQASFRDRLPLEVRLETDKPEYRVGDTITFTVTVSNPTARPVTFFNDKKWTDLDQVPVDNSMYYGDQRDMRYKELDGTEGYVVGRLWGGPVSRNTHDARFTTLVPGGSLTRKIAESAKVPGRWEIQAWLRSRQNYLVTGHYPMSGCFGFKTGDPVEDAKREKRAKEAKAERRRRMAEKGWAWDGEARFYYKARADVVLGEARSNEIIVIVREKQGGGR
jgi:hypothetical protein